MWEHLTAEEAITAVMHDGGDALRARMADALSFKVPGGCPPSKGSKGAPKGASKDAPSKDVPTNDAAAAPLPCMQDPLEGALPAAPSLQYYCLYGMGKPTERAFRYTYVEEPAAHHHNPLHLAGHDHAAAGAGGGAGGVGAVDGAPNGAAAAGNASSGNGGGGDASAWRIDADADDPRAGLDSGVYLSDGDGTVPLLSLAYLCGAPYRGPKLNPAGMRVVAREYTHAPAPGTLQGGGTSGDHVDIMGNHELVSDLLAIAAGRGGALEDRVAESTRAMIARAWQEQR